MFVVFPIIRCNADKGASATEGLPKSLMKKKLKCIADKNLGGITKLWQLLSMAPFSVIIHFDLDCFYAQVERQRLKLDAEHPVVVIQWTMALAATYSARAIGVNRGTTLEQARRISKTHNLAIVHVDTIGPKCDWPNPREHKVSLSRYRRASGEVFAKVQETLKETGARIERGSIDEMWVDVSTEVEKRMQEGRRPDRGGERVIVEGGMVDVGNEEERRVMFGVEVAEWVRKEVRESCGYTMSAGVSVNKLMAKVGSGRNKPNGVTVVVGRAVEGLLEKMEVGKLRGLGGKLGERVKALGDTIGEVRKAGKEKLITELGPRDGVAVWDVVRGVDSTEVQERVLSKSLLAAKSFSEEGSLQGVAKWVRVLANELAERMKEDEDMYRRRAKTLTVSFRRGNKVGARSVMMPGERDIEKVAIGVIRKVMEDGGGLNFVGLTAGNFVERKEGAESIVEYLGKEKKHVSKRSHEKRLQERKDWELAMQLHREESTGGRGVVKRRKKKGGSMNGVAKLDAFGFGRGR